MPKMTQQHFDQGAENLSTQAIELAGAFKASRPNLDAGGGWRNHALVSLLICRLYTGMALEPLALGVFDSAA